MSAARLGFLRSTSIALVVFGTASHVIGPCPWEVIGIGAGIVIYCSWRLAR
jgi:hypothetical protein